jgi:3-phosphoshikimate 1-carboxyvinyltransferase
MKYIVNQKEVFGTIQAPASKSSMQRACAAALLKRGESSILRPGGSQDDLAALAILKEMGALVESHNEKLTIDSSRAFTGSSALNIHCGESGLGIRMFTPIVSLHTQKISVTGHGSLLKRPMHFFDEVLPQLKVELTSNNGYLPFQLKGPLIPTNITVDGSLSSQYLTGLIMAFAGAAVSHNSCITVKNLKSKPYVDLTLDVLSRFGLPTPLNENYERFIFQTRKLPKEAHVNYTVEGDWSGSAFLLVAGATNGHVTVNGLSIHSTQADKKVLEAIRDSGAYLAVSDKEISVAHPGRILKPFYFDATDCPDLFPPLAVLAAACGGTSRIRGVHRLTHKESNRALSIHNELGKLGITVSFDNDDMLIIGNNKLNSAQVHSRHDHRIAMACAVAALRADGPVEIEEAEAINKSYPDFFRDLQKISKGNG